MPLLIVRYLLLYMEPVMLEIGDALVSLDVIEKEFICNLEGLSGGLLY